MLRNYFKTALRNLLKHKADSAINLVGLCLAFTSALLLFLSVFYEFSYDDFHEKAGRVHMLYTKIYRSGKVETSNSLPMPFAPTLKASFPDIEAAARDLNTGCTAEYQNRKFGLNLKLTDPDFLRIFSFPVLKGSATQALAGLNGVVIRQSKAEAMFGKEDPIGKTVRLNIRSARTIPGEEWKPFVVTAVIADAPENSSISYDMLARFENGPYYATDQNNWDNWNHSAHVLMRPGVRPADFQRKAKPFMERYFRENIDWLKREGAKPAEDGSYMQVGLIPLADYHTHPDMAVGNAIDKSYLYLLLTVGILIVAIACINFINLSIGRSFTRTREIGLRKTLGALPWQLSVQFWCEVFLVSLFAFVASGILAYYLLPAFRQVFAMSLKQEMLLQPQILLISIPIFLLVTLLAGGYPVWLIARLQVVDVLRGKTAAGGGKRVRNPLIVVQFSIATLLIICTIIAWQQIDFLRSKPLGYNRHQIISIPADGEMPTTRVLELMRQELAGKPGIVSISGMYDNLGRGTDGSSRTSITGFDYKGKHVSTHWMGITYDFVKTLDLQLVAGRDFSRSNPSDSNCVLINEAMAAEIGEKDPIGAMLPADSANPVKVIGVVKDFNFKSLKQKIAPLTLLLDENFPVNYVLVKVAPDNLPASMAMLATAWKKVQPGEEFLGSFLDENIERQYKHEEKLGHMFIAGAVIAILLSCMGLLAIVILVLAQRTREIGIRKVLGASVSGLVAFIFRDFLRLVLLSILIASPLAWYAASRWLEDFSYRIPIHWWVFALAGAITLGIALLTVMTRALQAATANPVKSLRTE